jgi:hypothetical protein
LDEQLAESHRADVQHQLSRAPSRAVGADDEVDDIAGDIAAWCGWGKAYRTTTGGDATQSTADAGSVITS